MTRLFYGTKALVRIILFVLLYPLLKTWRYTKPERVGFQGGVDAFGHTLAFRRYDGGLQFYW